MSGIIGINRSLREPDELQILEASIRRMAKPLAHRGPDGQDVWAGAWSATGVALGHLALHTTPEAHAETIPLRAEVNGQDLVLTCDARLDNRPELLAELSAELQALAGASEPLEAAPIGDSTLILASYLRWGRGCASHLLGDFAFSIWDGRARELFCARDHVGVKPFYFFHGPGLFAFASEIKALFEVPGVPRVVNEKRVAEYLMGAFSSHEDTSFEKIHRLPAAHTLVFSERGLDVERYWDLRDTPMLLGLSDGEYEERFRTVLFEAVRCRMRAPVDENAVGGFLSGGMDSSAVVCVAREIQHERAGYESGTLPVFSAIYNEAKECDERLWMQPVIDMGGLQAHWMDGEESSPLSGLEDVLWHTDEPILGPNLCSSWGHYEVVRARGVRVILDGHGGDETIGHGHARLHELMQAGQWRSLWRELRLSERNGFDLGEPAPSILWRAISHRVGPLRLAVRVARGVGRRLPRRAGQNVAKSQESTESPWELLNDEFALRIGAEEMHRNWKSQQPRNIQGDRVVSEESLSGPLQGLAFEELDKAAASAGVEARYPLWDKRLIELCLSMPPGQKRRDGWSRSILRRALEGILPREVQWRASKNDFTVAARLSLRHQETVRLEHLAHGEMPCSGRYVNVGEAVRCAGLLLQDQERDMDNTPLSYVVRIASFEGWLQAQPSDTASESAHTLRSSAVETEIGVQSTLALRFG